MLMLLVTAFFGSNLKHLHELQPSTFCSVKDCFQPYYDQCKWSPMHLQESNMIHLRLTVLLASEMVTTCLLCMPQLCVLPLLSPSY